jgi:hypothetical protein
MAERAAPAPGEQRGSLARFLHAPDDETAQGYLFWGPVVVAILVAELLGAFFDVPWPTISSTVGHLEDRWTIVAAIVVGIIAAAAFHALTGGAMKRTSLGRTQMRAGETRPVPYYTAAVPIVATIVAGLAARAVTDNKLVVGYWIYGTLAVLGIILPSVLVAVFKRDVQFPTLFFTVARLRERFHWTATLLVASLAILGVHLALYPWPDITKEPTQYAGLDARHAKAKALQAMAELRSGKEPLRYSTQARGIDSGKDAWLVFFTAPKDAAGAYGGCVVAVRNDTARPSPGCSE